MIGDVACSASQSQPQLSDHLLPSVLYPLPIKFDNGVLCDRNSIRQNFKSCLQRSLIPSKLDTPSVLIGLCEVARSFSSAVIDEEAGGVLLRTGS